MHNPKRPKQEILDDIARSNNLVKSAQRGIVSAAMLGDMAGAREAAKTALTFKRQVHALNVEFIDGVLEKFEVFVTR